MRRGGLRRRIAKQGAASHLRRMLSPIARAVAQLHDPAFLLVLAKSLALSALAFVLLVAGCVWGIHALLPHAWGWAAGVAGGIGAAVLAIWLFLPLAVVIAACFVEPVAAAVDRRFYPWLPQPRGASLGAQLWDGVALGGRVLLLSLLGLVLALALPGIGAVLSWLIAAWALGRGLFVAVAMRRMGRRAAQDLYRRQRGLVLAQGGVLALLAALPPLNLLVPVLGAAAMVHVLHRREVA